MRFVLDNSVVMRWLFGDGSPQDRAYAERVLDLLLVEGNLAWVPGIWPLEVGNVLLRAEAKGLLTEARASEFLGALQAMSIQTDGQTSTQALTSTLQLACWHRLSSYDAAYLELALRQGLALATLDTDLQRAAVQSGVGLV
jgi:predicted nucleic acid-binding protein